MRWMNAQQGRISSWVERAIQQEVFYHQRICLCIMILISDMLACMTLMVFWKKFLERVSCRHLMNCN